MKNPYHVFRRWELLRAFSAELRRLEQEFQGTTEASVGEAHVCLRVFYEVISASSNPEAVLRCPAVAWATDDLLALVQSPLIVSFIREIQEMSAPTELSS